MDGKSLDIANEKIQQLRNIFPEAFSEDKVDFKRLRDVLGDNVNFSDEHYELGWVGKAEARKEVQRQTTATLIPAKDDSVNFDDSENIFIEGENLEVLRVLQKSYFGKVKLIYIDPPYNTGNDSFIYPDDFSERLEEFNKRAGYINDEGYINKQDLWKKNTKESGHFHSVWLSMMYPRLYLAKNLLQDDGVILVSIGDDEIDNLRLIMNEIFGQENQIGMFTWKSRAKPTNAGDSKYKPQKVAEYIMAYAKGGADKLLFNVTSAKNRQYPNTDEKGKYRTTTILTSNRGMFKRETMRFEVGGFKPDDDQRWKAGYTLIKGYYDEGRIGFNDEGTPFLKHYEEDESDALFPLYTYLNTELTGTAENGKSELNELVGKRHGFDTVKPVNLLRYLIATFSNDDSIIMDFFAGSATTAQAVLELNYEEKSNRKFLLVQMPELIGEDHEAFSAGFKTIPGICRLRIQKVIEKLKAEDSKSDNLNGEDTVLGYKSFRLSPSNFNIWKTDISGKDAILKQLQMFVNSDKPGSEQENMLYELLLKLGKPLTSKIEEKQSSSAKYYYLPEHNVCICLEKFDSNIRKQIHLLNVRQVIILNKLFINDEDLSNTKLEFKEADTNLVII